MVRKAIAGALSVAFVATAAVAQPVLPSMALPADLTMSSGSLAGGLVPAQDSTQSAPTDQSGTQHGHDGNPEPARGRVPRRSGFFGLPLALIAAAGAGAATTAVLTASPQ